MTFPGNILDLASQLVDLSAEKKIMVTAAESCTGGLVAAAITAIPGASKCLMGAFISYSDYMKERLLGVSDKTIQEHGAVSEAVAREMAEGALKAASADIAIAVTGIAGPGGGSKEKPIGLVHFASARRARHAIQTHHEKHLIEMEGRDDIRIEAVRIALAMLLVEAGNYQEGNS